MSAAPTPTAGTPEPQISRSEWNLILLCLRPTTDPAARERIRLLFQGEINWPQILAGVARHRVTPSFFEGVMDLAGDLVPPEYQARMHESARQSAANSLMLLREMLRIGQWFEAAKLPVIPYKGPVLAWLAYGSFVKRDYSDLDFALQQRFIPQAAAVLREHGFAAGFDEAEVREGHRGSAPGQYAFAGSEQNLQVELHTERTLRYFPTPLDLNLLGGRLLHVTIASHSVPTFSIEDTLVMLAVHGAKHFWERLAWILDIAKLTQAQPVDWQRTLDIAREMKSLRLLLLGLYLAHDLLADTPGLDNLQPDAWANEMPGRAVTKYEAIARHGVHWLQSRGRRRGRRGRCG